MAVPITRSAQRWQSLAIAASLLFLVSAGLLIYDLAVKPGAPAANKASTDTFPALREKIPAGILRLADNPVWDGSGIRRHSESLYSIQRWF